MIIGNLKFGTYLEVLYPFYVDKSQTFQRVEGALSSVTLGRVIICDFMFERTGNHNFTITTCGILSLFDICYDMHLRYIVTFYELCTGLLVIIHYFFH